MQQFPQNQVSPRNWILAAMIVFAVAVRLVINYVPGLLPYNFTPVEAIALFGGAYFVNRRLAFTVPLIAMLCADLIIATSLPREWVGDWLGTLPAVYGCIALTVLGGMRLSRKISVFRVTSYAFASAVMFFLVTNFATWLSAQTGAGAACTQSLADCYVAGIPFFRGTLVGALLWSAILFGGFELMRRRWTALSTATA
ncbi:MAG: hypothetical protein DYH18_12475 [Xanthomonadales bacterium PRO7]|jgi:hypothetical protein|nr:hypothetical protein [Xanthomonadales bacterium PRO7]HMM58024.1 hypothetical protein [Rudaea sp.]